MAKILIDLNEYASNPMVVLEKLNKAVAKHGLKPTEKATTRKQQILNYLLTGESLSQLQATAKGWGTRLGSAIFQLRKAGYPIDKFDSTENTSIGKKATFANYYLPKDFIENYKLNQDASKDKTDQEAVC